MKTPLPRFMKYDQFVTANRVEVLGKLVPRLLFVRKQDKQDFAEVWVLTADRFNLKASFSKLTEAGSGRTTMVLMRDRDRPDDVAYLVLYSGGQLEDWLLIPESPPT